MKKIVLLTLLGTLNLAAIFFLSVKVLEVDAKISLIHAFVGRAPPATGPTAATIEVPTNRAADIWPRVKEVTTTWTTPRFKTDREIILELAELIAEIDGNLYAADEQKVADAVVSQELELLKRLIRSRVATLAEQAPRDDAKAAAEKMTEINQLLAVYPAPRTDAQRTELASLTQSILTTSRRIEDVTRLRYNAWALGRIENGLKRYRFVETTRDIDDPTRRERFLTDCINSLKEINTAYLDPPALELYSHVYDLTKSKLKDDEPRRVALAMGFADPAIKRKTPFDFHLD